MRHIATMYGDPSPLVKLRITQGIVTITEMDIDLILKHDNFIPIADLMGSQLKTQDQRVA